MLTKSWAKSWLVSGAIALACLLFACSAKAQYGCGGGTVTQSQQTIGYIPINQVATTSYQTVYGAPIPAGGGCNGGTAMMSYGCSGGAPAMSYGCNGGSYQYVPRATYYYGYGCGGGTAYQQNNYYSTSPLSGPGVFRQRTRLFGNNPRKTVIRQY